MTGKELEQIYNEAYKAVYWTALSLLKNEADAEDVVQDTFVSFIEKYSDMTDTSKAAALLKKIAANKCLDRIKLARTDNMEDEFFDSVEAVPEDFLPDTIVESAEMRKIIMDIIEQSLSEDIRRTLILFYFDEMSTKEIAEALGVPQGTVLRRLNFARNKIKKEVEKYEKEKNTKLFGAAMALPFLSKLFIKEAETVPFKPMPASLTSILSASVKASAKEAGAKIAASAVKKGTSFMFKKILLIVVAVVAVGAVTGGIIFFVSKAANEKPEDKYIEESEDSEEEEEVAVVENESEEEEVVPADTEPSVSDETTKKDITKYFNPDADLITGTPTILGNEIVLPCTIGDLKALGYTTDGVVSCGRMGMTKSYVYTEVDEEDGEIYEEERETGFEVVVGDFDYNADSVTDDTVVYGINLTDAYAEFEMGGITSVMGETQFLEIVGTPAYVRLTPDDFQRSDYIFLDENGNAYRFIFYQYIDSDEDPILAYVTWGTPEYWQDWTIMEG